MTYTRETSPTRKPSTSDESSEEIRADIADKRSEMSHKLDAIQDQFKPERIREQAQETVRSVVDDGVKALRDYVNDNGKDIGASLGRSIKKHPVPAALVGIGLGWMLIDSLSGDSDEHNFERRYYRGDNAYRSPEYGYGYQQFERAEMYGLEGSPEEYVDEMDGNTYTRSTNYGSGAERNYASNGEGSENDEGIVERVQDAAQGAIHKAQEGAQAVANQVQNQAENIAGSAQHYTHQAGQQTQRRTSQWGDEARHGAQRARYGAQRAGRQAYRTIEDNPLTFGIVALGIGAAIGLALPETRQEDRMLGDARDRVFDAAQEAASDVSHRAQRVVEEVRPEVEQTAKKVADDLQNAGREAMEDLKQTGKESAQAVKETAQDAADTARQEAEGAKHDVKNRAEDAKDDIGEKVKPQG